jgi:hypothetical protein
MRWIGASCALVGALLAGCSTQSVPGVPHAAGADASTQAPAFVDPALERNATYGSVTELRDAAEGAGYVCTGWALRLEAANAAEMADCDYTTVLMTFATEYDKQANIEYFEQTGGTLLIGPNWIVNGEPDALDEIAPELGGTRWSRPGP